MNGYLDRAVALDELFCDAEEEKNRILVGEETDCFRVHPFFWVKQTLRFSNFYFSLFSLFPFSLFRFPVYYSAFILCFLLSFLFGPISEKWEEKEKNYLFL